MISKEGFILALESVKKIFEWATDFGNFLQCKVPIFTSIDNIITCIAYETAENQNEVWVKLIFAFIYDYEWGTNYGDDGYLFELDGTRYRPLCIGDLYDSIVKDIKGIES